MNAPVIPMGGIDEIITALDRVAGDRTVPKNIRTSCASCIQKLREGKGDLSIKLNACIAMLDEVSNDPNIPTHARIQVWQIVSMLEVVGKEN